MKEKERSKKSRNSSMNTEVHMIPVEMRENRETEEVVDIIEEKKQVIYVRGKKMIGEEIAYVGKVAKIVKVREEEEENQRRMVKSKEVEEVKRVLNYEREGSEKRFIKEIDKIKEMVNINEYVHE